MIRHDFRQGIVKYIWSYLLFAGVCYWSANYYYLGQVSQNEILGRSDPVSAVSMLLYIMHGMGRYVPGPNQVFRLSIVWIMPFVLLAYSVYAYPQNDLGRFGYNYILRTKSRAGWWYAKCIWLLIHILICCVVCSGMCVVCAWVKQQPIWAPASSGQLEYLGLHSLQNMSSKEIIVCAGIYLTMLSAICLVQLLLSFLMKPMAAYICVIVMYVTSAYCTVWVLPGNYLMLQRYECFLSEGVSVQMGYLSAVLLILLSVIGGRYYMKRKDIL